MKPGGIFYMKLNAAVFFGGESVEHEVSIISAHQAMEAMDRNKYNVIPIYVAKNRKLYVSELLNDMKNYKDLNGLVARCTQVTLANVDNRVVILPVKTSSAKRNLAPLMWPFRSCMVQTEKTAPSRAFWKC